MTRLFLNHLRRTWALGSLVALGVFGFFVIAMRAYTGIVLPGGVEGVATRLPKQVQAVLGIDRIPINTLNGFLSLVIQHPFVLAAALAVPIAMASALLTREIEQRTLALLLVRRVPRAGIVLSAAAVIALWLGAAAGGAWAGILAGAQWVRIQPGPDPAMVLRLVVNLYLLLLAGGGLSLFFAACVGERGEAIQWTMVPLLIMYVWNFLAQFWPAARPWARFMLFHYYSPPGIILGGAIPQPDLQVLGAVAVTGTVLACLVFWRREFNL